MLFIVKYIFCPICHFWVVRVTLLQVTHVTSELWQNNYHVADSLCDQNVKFKTIWNWKETFETVLCLGIGCWSDQTFKSVWSSEKNMRIDRALSWPVACTYVMFFCKPGTPGACAWMFWDPKSGGWFAKFIDLRAWTLLFLLVPSKLTYFHFFHLLTYK